MLRLWIALCALSSSAISANAAEPAQSANAPIPVGIAVADITPDYPVRLNGFGFRREESAGVRQHIFAKALAIGSDADGPAVLITVDTLGIPDAVAERVRDVLQKQAGIRRDRLAITASHTHTAPMVNHVSPTLFGTPIPPEHQAHIDQHSEDLFAKLVEVSLAALKDRQPSQLSWSLGQVGFAKNRRTKEGPVDHDLPLLAARDIYGRLRAVYVNYACHCVCLSDNRISGDWAGYAMEQIERQNPKCVALVSVGCGADANPLEGVVGDKWEVADRHGLEIAAEVNRLLQGPLTPVTGPLVSQWERIDLAFAPHPTREEWEQRAELQNAVGHHARTQLARLDRGESLLTKVSYPIQTWSFGDSLAMVFLPGEVVVDYSKRLKKELDGRRLWVNAYANACPGYVPSERILTEGGYEGGGAMVYYDLPGPYAPGLEQPIVSTVRKQLDATFAPPVETSRTQGIPPRTPAQSIAALRLRDGYVAELAAAEPLVASPVAVDFGPDGRLWVAEMYDYPAGADGQFSPGGRVRVLHDSDRDGRFDRAQVFLEGIPFPTGVTVWRDGVLICAAPDILFARDTDGDDRADDVQRLFSGFATHNYQARVNSLEYGLDGWVYGSSGLFGGEITCHKTGNVVSLGRRDFRIDPDRGVIEPAIGATQQGRVRNDWGDWFGCNNGQFVLHYPMEEAALRRNPRFQPPAMAVSVPSGGDAGQVFPISETIRFKLSGPAGRATAACGLGIYRDDLLGSGVSGNSFTCEPVNNLVHRRVLSPNGVVFQGLRAPGEEQAEFVASTDPWFRPVQARTGPDGALWIVDMYRFVIEHPIWIPPETLAELDPRAGADRGRLYRILPRGGTPREWLRLAELDGPGLVAALDSPNGWQRDMAQQLLVWNQETGVADDLAALVRNADRPVVRMQALCVLELLGELQTDLLAQTLTDGHPGVRRQAVRIAAGRLKKEDSLLDVVLGRASDPDRQVQLQVAYSLGDSNDPRAAVALARLARQHAGDSYLVAGVLSSLTAESAAAVYQAALTQPGETPATLRKALLAQVAALSPPAALGPVIAGICRPVAPERQADQFRSLSEVLPILARQSRSVEDLLPEADRGHWESVVSAARSTVASASAAESLRLAAMGLVAVLPGGHADDIELLGQLLSPQTPGGLQQAAIAGLSRRSGDEVAHVLLAHWGALSPDRRGEILGVLLSRPAWTGQLLTAIDEQAVQAGELETAVRQRLLEHPTVALRERAAKLLTLPGSADRKELIQRYLAEATDAGNPQQGRELFAKRCATCHRLQDVGQTIGPDLSPYSTKPFSALVTAVLDPNQAVDPRYHNYAISLDDGRVLSGMIQEEAAAGFKVASADGKFHSVLRTEVEELKNSARSLMPEGFEKDVSPAALADLQAWLTSLQSPPKSLPGNQPTVVKSGADGVVVLTAAKAAIYGDQITFENEFGNIGYWHSPQDHVIWTCEIPQAGEFDVWVDAACDATVAGNLLGLSVGDATLTQKVASTGGWNQYRLSKLGRVTLPAGMHQVRVQPAGGGLDGALMDLRMVALTPPGKHPPSAGGALAAAPVIPGDPASMARFLIDDAHPREQREKLIADFPQHSAAMIAVMGATMEPGTPEEYRRIPWIWRIAIAAGKRNQDAELLGILKVTLPRDGEPLRDWQAVVIGGGLINGISMLNVWPGDRFAKLLAGEDVLRARWQRSLELSLVMADNEKVPTGTRYDALRMLPLLGWERAQASLTKYAKKGTHAELQMGSVSGSIDVPAAEATALLVGLLSHAPQQNRELALDGLLRTPDRCLALLEAVKAGTLPREQLGDKRIAALRQHAEAAVREAAAKALP